MSCLGRPENRGDGTFAPPREELACGGRSTLAIALVDLDGDRAVDAYVANDFFDDCLYENLGDGRNEVHIATHEQREELLFAREGDRFVPVLPAMRTLGVEDSRGSAYGDITGDGAVDIVVARRGAPLQVIRNDSGGSYLEVEIAPAHRALGSVVVAHIGGDRRVEPIQAGSSYLSSSPPVAHFGLCGGERVDRVEVEAPDGARAVAHDVEPGRLRLELD